MERVLTRHRSDLSVHATRRPPIAIDGPAGAGKTSVGQRLASRLGYRFLDTGRMYRAVTLAALETGVPVDDAAQVARLTDGLEFKVIAGQDGETRIILNGQDVTDRLREPEVDRNVSAVSAVPHVRQVMVAEQRRIARQGSIVMVGRDIGTVVLPDAEVKVFLTASPETRARRRYGEVISRGEEGDYAVLLQQILRRDDLDASRAASPMRPADDARVIDTDGMSLDQVVDAVAEMVAAPSR